MTTHAALPTASALDSITFLLDVFVPTVAKGPIKRRPRVEELAERLRLDERALARMRKLDHKYPQGPLLLRLPLRNQAVVLRPSELHFVLRNTPEPFSPASSEKRGALAHFEPRNVLISTGLERSARRALQEQALDTDSPVHRFSGHFLPIIAEETDALLAEVRAVGQLDWSRFTAAWHRAVRRVVFGDGARDDVQLTDMLARLRKDANWSALKPVRSRTRAAFLDRVHRRMLAAGPGSLAYTMRAHEPSANAAPTDQIPQWLFAFEPAGMATFRALAVLSTHPDEQRKARLEIAGDTSDGKHLPYLRSCVLESLRLWPTTPMILRQSTQQVQWPDGVMPPGCGVLVFAPYFHRDGSRLREADAFNPELWLRDDPEAVDDWGLVPFSEGPARCPGRQLVLLLTSAMLARLLKDHDFQLMDPHRLAPERRLPGNLNTFSLDFEVVARP
ncbi:cytochrome P450 [Paenarthrobacter sp. NPDC089322]|uniref:cytochrome P450 n=1 Tax=Paenarthrobacter sp. NPDC089322 TaxID=3155065 RepID=UPI003431A387